MCCRCLSWPAVFCSLAFSCSSPAENVPEEPAVSVSLREWETGKSSFSGKREFSLSLKMTEESSWKVGWCEAGGAKVTVKDSEGSSSCDVGFYYHSFRELWPDDRTGRFSVHPKSWLPSAGAKWVEVKGTVPFVMFLDSRVTGSVKLKLVTGSSVPLLLKGGGMDGRDVQAELSVDEYREKSEGACRSWTVFKLKSPSRVGIQRLELLDKDGMPVKVERRGEVGGDAEQGYEWSSHMVLDHGKGEELNLAVTYMAGFRKITVPVGVRFGLFGTAEKKDVL